MNQRKTRVRFQQHMILHRIFFASLFASLAFASSSSSVSDEENLPKDDPLSNLKDIALRVILKNKLIDFTKTDDIPNDQAIPRSLVAEMVMKDPVKFINEYPDNGMTIIGLLINSNLIPQSRLIELLEQILYYSEEPEMMTELANAISNDHPAKKFVIDMTVRSICLKTLFRHIFPS